MRSFAMVASALGDRFKVRVRIAGDQAFTDGELVVLPQLPEGSEYTEAAWGYLVHEAAHLRFTDFELAHRRCSEMPDLYRHVWNIFEDLRIERALADLYPGVPRMINSVIKRVIKDEVFKAVSPESHPARVLTGYLLYAGRCEVVGQSLLAGIAAETARSLEQVFPSIAADVNQVLVKAGAARSTADTLALADEIYALLDRLPQQSPASDQGEGDDNSSSSGNAGEGDGEHGADQAAASPSHDGEQPKESEQSDDTKQSAGSDVSPDVDETLASDGNDGLGDSRSNQPDGRDDQAQEADPSAERSTRADSGDPGAAATAGPPAGSERGSRDDGADQSDQNADDVSAGGKTGRSDHGDNVDAAEQAKAYSPTSDGALQSDLGDVIAEALKQAKDDRGVNPQEGLTLEEVIRIADSDPVVDTYAEGLFVEARSHSFPLRRSLVSLLESRARTNRWCVEQGRRVKTSRLSRLRTGNARIFERRFTKKAINTAITLLLDSSSSMNANDRMRLAKEACVALSLAIDAMQGVALEVMTFPYGSASLGRHGFGLAKDLNETTAVIKKRFSRIASSGGTPMAPAIITAGARLLRRPEPRKVMLVLTDGEPDSLALTHAAIETMKGIEMIGIGIESSEVARVFERFIVIQDVRELPKQLLTKARELLAA